MAQLINTASVVAEYQSMEVVDSTQVIVELSAVSIRKTANKQLWLDNEELTYSIEVRNVDAAVPGDPISNIVVTDRLDIEITSMVEGSLTVTIGANPTPVTDPDFEYDELTGLLTVRLDDLPAGGYATISFRVEKVAE